MADNSQSASNIQTIAAQLREQEAALVAERRVLESRQRETDRNIRSVRAALAALGVKSDRPGEARTSKRSAMTTAEVFLLVKDMLSRDGPADPLQLRQKIEQKARESGRSLIGFHLRFAKALKDPRLCVADGVCVINGDDAKSSS